MITSQDGSTSLKHVAEWTYGEDNEALRNSNSLNSILNGIKKNMFRFINTCIEAKDAWDILKTSHEGTLRLKMSKMQLLTTKV